MIGSTIARMNILVGATDRATPVLGNILGTLGKIAVVGGSIAGITIFSKQCIDSAVRFEETLVNSLVMFDDLDDAMRNKMAKAAREMAKEIPRSANECAEAYYYLGSAGLDASTALKALPIIGKFAVATNLDMARAAQVAATTLKQWEISVEELPPFHLL